MTKRTSLITLRRVELLYSAAAQFFLTTATNRFLSSMESKGCHPVIEQCLKDDVHACT